MKVVETYGIRSTEYLPYLLVSRAEPAYKKTKNNTCTGTTLKPEAGFAQTEERPWMDVIEVQNTLLSNLNSGGFLYGHEDPSCLYSSFMSLCKKHAVNVDPLTARKWVDKT